LRAPFENNSLLTVIWVKIMHVRNTLQYDLIEVIKRPCSSVSYKF